MRNSWLFQLNLSVEILFLLSTGVLPSCELIKGKIIFFLENVILVIIYKSFVIKIWEILDFSN